MTIQSPWYDVAAPTLPKLAATVIGRPKVDAWLARHAAAPLRLLAAPAGSGKTTALASYLARTQKRAAYIDIVAGEQPEKLRERIACALGVYAAPSSLAALLTVLASCAPCEIAVDGIDNAPPETIAELRALVEEAPDGVALLYASCNRDAIDVRRHLLRGVAMLFDADALAFDADETMRLASRHGVPCTENAIAALLRESEGWAIVVDGAIRHAAERNQSLDGAYAAWCGARGRDFTAFIAAELGKTAYDNRLAFELAAKGEHGSEHEAALSQLESHGLFVRYERTLGFRPYRVAAALAPAIAAPQRPATVAVKPLKVRLFARFDARIDERPIAWIRRRDRQLFAYLLLQPGGTATRREVREAFWPHCDDHSATQNIRTACSNIRKAIAQIVGYDDVERYFSSLSNLVVHLAHVDVDAARFSAHVQDGDRELERGDGIAAQSHFRAAHDIYCGDLFSAEFPETWQEPHVAKFRTLRERSADRLKSLSSAHFVDLGRRRNAETRTEAHGRTS